MEMEKKEALRMEKVNAILNETENGKKLKETLERERREQIESIFKDLHSKGSTTHRVDSRSNQRIVSQLTNNLGK